jgi:rubrerythrin
MVRRFLLQLIMEESIRREEDAYRFYELAQESVREQAARHLLHRLCAQELGHRLKLEELQRRGNADLSVQAATPEEVKLLEDFDPVPTPALADLQLAGVWRLALHRERLSAAHYGLISHKIALDLPRRIFAFLAAEEQRHVEWVLGAMGGQP